MSYPHDAGGTPFDDLADLDRFGRGAAPQHQFALGIESLADGPYDCEIASATLDRIDEHRILRTHLRLLKEGRTIEHLYWLNKQESINGFLAEMSALGFPSAQWGDGPGKVPLSRAIPQCASQLKGLKFRGLKTSRHVDAQVPSMGKPGREAKTYHDLRIQSRITGASMPGVNPQTQTAPAPAAPAPAAPAPQPNWPQQDPNDIPF